MKRYITAYLLMFFLGGAAPIALNGGSSIFDGGSISSQILAPNGTTAAPAYSFSTETGSGIWRNAADDLRLQAEDGLALVYSGTTSHGMLSWDSNLTDVSSTSSSPAIISTDSDSGITATTRIMNFVMNGAGIGSIRSDGATNNGGICLDDSATAPCLQIINTSGGNLVISSVNGGQYNGTFDLGADGNLSINNSVGIHFASDTDTGFGSISSSTLTFRAGNVTTTQFSSNDLSSNTNVRFFYVSTSAGAPTAGDCDADAERGRMVLDTTNGRFYVCGGATRLWDYITLTNDGTK
jgi:hypothetical protein